MPCKSKCTFIIFPWKKIFKNLCCLKIYCILGLRIIFNDRTVYSFLRFFTHVIPSWMSLRDLPALESWVVQPGRGNQEKGRTRVNGDWPKAVGRKHRELPPRSSQRCQGTHRTAQGFKSKGWSGAAIWSETEGWRHRVVRVTKSREIFRGRNLKILLQKSSHLSVYGHLVVCASWLLWVMLQWTWECGYLF